MWIRDLKRRHECEKHFLEKICSLEFELSDLKLAKQRCLTDGDHDEFQATVGVTAGVRDSVTRDLSWAVTRGALKMW